MAVEEVRDPRFKELDKLIGEGESALEIPNSGSGSTGPQLIPDRRTRAGHKQRLSEHQEAMRKRNLSQKQGPKGLTPRARDLALFYRNSKVSPSAAMELVEEFTGISRAQLKMRDGRRDNDAVCQARQLTWWLILNFTIAGYSDIGRMFKRHHSTILHGCNEVSRRRAMYAEWRHITWKIGKILRKRQEEAQEKLRVK